MMSERVKIWGGRTARWSILGTLTIFLAFPFVWMLITAFKRTGDLYDLKHNPFLFYEPPTLEHIHAYSQKPSTASGSSTPPWWAFWW